MLMAQMDIRTETLLREGWKFQKGDIEGAQSREFNDSAWEDVLVPHDWAIEAGFILDGDGNTGKLPWKGEAWYRKSLFIPKEQAGNHFYLLCDGIMAFPSIYVNGQLAGQWDYGYNSFYLDITKYLQPGSSNVLAIHVDTRKHDSRWYPGAGIYRKIKLISVPAVHVALWGTEIITPIIKPHYADVRIGTQLENNLDAAQEIECKLILLDPEKRRLNEQSKQIILSPGSTTLEMEFTVSNPERWDIGSPRLYTLQTQLLSKDQVIDQTETRFGIRDMRFTADHGFYLNDRRVQLKGVNLHHDLGPLGAAFNKRAMERQLEIMMDMGCNAIRTSHNPPAPELLDLCDSLGLLVIDELFDKYDAKADITDTTDFEQFAHRQVSNFIRRDRNHPSVFLWSVGNEIGDVQWNLNGGFRKLQTMVQSVRKYDPYRPVTLVCDNEKSARLRHFDFYDVHAWNYGRRYKLARQIEANKAVIISESASTLSTRGFYEFPLPEKPADFTTSLQVSSYDLNAPWWAEIADDDFMWQQEESYVAGEFVWTGFDYLGEPTPYNNEWMLANGIDESKASRSSYFGIVDLCGIPKDRYYLYKSYWRPEETTLHILPHWNWPEHIGKNIPVFVYTNGDCAELFLNGRSLGKRCKDPKSENSTERFRLMWKDVVYEPGELKVIAYKNGQKIATEVRKTTGDATTLKLTPDRLKLLADGEALSYILVEATDSNGLPHPLANDLLHIKLDGPGRIVGVGNGNPQSMDPFKSDTVYLFYGKAMILVQSTGKPGEISVQVNSGNLKMANCTLECH